MGQLIGARPLPFLFGGGLGGWLLVAGLTLVCGGLLWADHITDRATA
jgi:tight adherence protein B